MSTPDENSRLRIVVAGSGRLGMAVLEPLLDSGYEVVAVVQNGRKVPRWERKLLGLQARITPRMPSPLCEAVRQRIPIYWLEHLDATEIKSLCAMKPDLLITCGFSIILPESVLSIPRIGCINVHTALLPKHRGPNPCAWVVHDGDGKSGVTIHVTETGIDTGAVLAQESFDLSPTDTSMDVYLASCAVTAGMISETIADIEANGFANARVQDESEATYDKRFNDEQSRVDWTQSAVAIERLIRAAHAYAPAWFQFGKTRVRLVQAEAKMGGRDVAPGVIVAVDPELVVGTGDGTLTLYSTYTDQRGGTRWPGAFTKLKPGMRLE
ncbi:MAG: methionyl-tRNA formyltransferase [Candidatus Hydrogenedentota bacterium]